ncbi:PIR protein, putative [Plasmodium sp. gorilla clade G1]|nr:PIR protein, putative [Plasmodium sp. gorilla clade G1]
MKIHYINILLFALPLNILVTLCHVYNQRNHKSITLHTPNENLIKTHRSLCECELYAPQNYDNNPEMRSVMQDFDRQTSERLREYDERMNKNRQKCKDQCEKDIQKIILKDKIEKELNEKLSTLETNINTKDLPICECEKSLTEKVEKGCLGCGVLGSGIAPNVGLFGEVVLGAWKAAALVTAKKLAAKAGAAKGAAEGAAKGVEVVIQELYTEFGVSTEVLKKLGLAIHGKNYTNVSMITKAICTKYEEWSCTTSGATHGPNKTFCYSVWKKTLAQGTYSQTGASTEGVIKEYVERMVLQAKGVAGANTEAATEEAIATFTAQNTGAVNSTYASCHTAIITSIIAILVIVLVMVIIYLILRYRRKKKMKKKLQYIKLLKE